MKTGPVRDAEQTKECVYSIPCYCDRCYIGETGRSLEVRMLEWSEGLADWVQHHMQKREGISPHVSTGPSDQSDISPIWTHSSHSRSQETANPSRVIWVGKICFSCVGTVRSIASLQWWFLSWYFSGARPHKCGVSIIYYFLSSRRWFMLDLNYVSYIGVGTGVRS
jgi:hypothetical protein